MSIEESQRFARKPFGIFGIGLFLALAVVAWSTQQQTPTETTSR